MGRFVCPTKKGVCGFYATSQASHWLAKTTVVGQSVSQNKNLTVKM
jgi:hypothetical protein